MSIELVAAGGCWVVPLGGSTVTQCRVDFGFVLIIDGARGSFEIRIEQPFELRSVDGEPMLLSWGADPAALAPALQVLHVDLEKAVAFEDGRLEVRFADGGCLRVPASVEFEPWTLVGPAGLRLVSMPGGELAVWSPDGSAAASG